MVALSKFPDWAIQRAFDTWVRDEIRRPSPGHIVALARAELRQLTDELERRKRFDLREAQITAPVRLRISPEAAARIIAEVGARPMVQAAIRVE